MHPLQGRSVFPVVMSVLHPQPRVVTFDDQKPAETEMNLGELWLKFEQELRSFVRPRVDSSETCEDLLQSAFVRAQKSVTEGTHPREPRAWLYQIVRHLLVDTYRAQERRRNALATFRTEENEENKANAGRAVDTPEGHEQEVSDILARALPSFLSALGEPYRQALELTDLEGLSQAEAAHEAGVSLSCMKARVRRARRELLAALERCCTIQIDGRGRPIDCAPRASDTPCGCN